MGGQGRAGEGRGGQGKAGEDRGGHGWAGEGMGGQGRAGEDRGGQGRAGEGRGGIMLSDGQHSDKEPRREHLYTKRQQVHKQKSAA